MLGIVLLLAAILATRLVASVPAASLPLRDLAVLVDPAGTETIASVSAAAALGRFKPVEGDFNAGFTRHVHWLRFTVQAPAPGPRWLEVQPALLDDLRLFEPSVGGFTEYRGGSRQLLAKRDLDSRQFVFKLDVPDVAPRIFYLRIEAASSAQAQLRLWQPDDFRENERHWTLQLGCYLGLTLLQLSVNLVLWLMLREAMLNWLSLQTLAQAINLGAYGLVSLFFGADAPPPGDFWAVFSVALYMSSAAGFCDCLLRDDLAAGWLRFSIRAQVVMPWLLLPAHFSGHSVEALRLALGIWVIFVPLLLLLSVRQWRFGRVQSRWLVLANALALVVSGVYAMGLLGWPGLQPSQSLRLLLAASSGLAIFLALAGRFSAAHDENVLVRQRAEHVEGAAAMERVLQAQLQHLYDEKVALLLESERHQVLLRKSLEDLQQAHRLGRIGTWETDRLSRDTVYSPVTAEIFGLSGLRLINTHGERERFFVPESWQRLQGVVARAFTDGQPYVIELELLPVQGAPRWIEIRGVAVFDEPGRVVKLSGTAQDITERHHLQHATAAGLAESIANRNRSEFLARVSHELRTPLNAVLGFSQLLALEPTVRDSPLVAEQVGLIHSAADHLKSMIDDVLDLARIQSGGFRLVTEDCSVGPLAAECLSWLAANAVARRVSLHLKGQDRILMAVADHSRLRQILINLLSNAIKYNCIGGSVWLALSHEPASDASAAGWICMAVSDTGPGLTQGQIDSLYQPFNRLGAELGEVEGTGLGLSVARDLAEAMGGSLQVQSEVGKGSVFTLRLVAAAPPVPDGDASRANGPVFGAAGDAAAVDDLQATVFRAEHKPFVVVYVEDNRLNVMVMRHAIKRLPGVHLEVAIDGGTGLALAQRLRPDLLLLDMNMPVLSGTEVMLRVRADPTLATLTCVAVSANSLPEDIERAMSAGFDDYITKPFAVARVLDLVDRLRRQAGLKAEGPQQELLGRV